MTGRARASLQRLAHNAGPIAVLGVFLLLAVVVYAVLRINAQQKTLTDQGKTIVALQQAQADSSKTGRGILNQVASIGQVIAEQTSPTATATQGAKIAGYLGSLAAANQAALNDQTAKIAQMFEQCRALPCATSTISRILAQPVPVPTFAGMAAVTPAAPTSPILPTARATPTPRANPTPTLTPFLQVQCPVICPH